MTPSPESKTPSESTPAKKSSAAETKVSSGGGIPKWVIVVIVVVVVLYGLFYIGGMMIRKAIQAKTGITGMQVNEDGKSFQIKGKNGQMMQVGDGTKLPAAFPKNLPMYPGAKLVSAIDTGEGMSVAYTVENVTAEQLQTFYKTELPKNGWTNEMDKLGGGLFPIKNETYNGMIVVLAEKGVGHVQINMAPVKK